MAPGSVSEDGDEVRAINLSQSERRRRGGGEVHRLPEGSRRRHNGVLLPTAVPERVQERMRCSEKEGDGEGEKEEM